MQANIAWLFIVLLLRWLGARRLKILMAEKIYSDDLSGLP